MRLKFASVAFQPVPRPELRAKLREFRALHASKMPDAAIEEIVDIAAHAAECARTTLMEVLDRASDDRVSVTAAGIAASLPLHDLKTFVQGLEAAAAVTGIHFESSTLKVQAHG